MADAETETNTESEEIERETVKYFSEDNVKYLLTQLAERIKAAHTNE